MNKQKKYANANWIFHHPICLILLQSQANDNNINSERPLIVKLITYPNTLGVNKRIKFFFLLSFWFQLEQIDWVSIYTSAYFALIAQTN